MTSPDGRADTGRDRETVQATRSELLACTVTRSLPVSTNLSGDVISTRIPCWFRFLWPHDAYGTRYKMKHPHRR